MKTATQFAEEIKAISEDLDGIQAVVPAEETTVVEEIADWRGPLQDVQVRLRRMIQQDIDKFMESANKILSDAEKSDWSKVAIQNSVARWSGDINRVYADFKMSTKGFMDLVKAMGVTTRRHSTKGKAPSARGKMDWGKLSQVQLKKEVRDQIKRLSGGIHSLADDGAYMLHQIDRILKYKAPNDETIREEIGALYQDFVDFRNAFGSKVWGPYNGLIGRLNSVRDQPLGQRSKAYRSAMWKKPKAVGEDALPIDCPELREAIERDRLRATRGVLGEDQDEAQALIASIEDELLSEAAAEDDPEKGSASKMKAKGYNFKVLLKKGPPLYTKTEKGAKDVQKDYPGSKIVKNESGEIDDPAVIEGAEYGDLFDFFEDFDAMLYDEGEELGEGASDDAPFPLSEVFDAGKANRGRFLPIIGFRKSSGYSNYANWLDDQAEKERKEFYSKPGAPSVLKYKNELVSRISSAIGAKVYPLVENPDILTVGATIESGFHFVAQMYFGGFSSGTYFRPMVTWVFYYDRARKDKPIANPNRRRPIYAEGTEMEEMGEDPGTPTDFGPIINKAARRIASDAKKAMTQHGKAQTEAIEFENGVRIADGPRRQKMAIQQVFGFMRLRGGTISPGPGGRFMHGEVAIPGGKLEFDADRERLAWTAWANGSIVDKGHSPYGGSINRMCKPIQAAVKKVAAMQEDVEPSGDELTEMSEVVKTIFQQMGGGRGMMMIGGQAMAIDGNTLGIKWPSRHPARIGNYVEVKYIPGADLYDMEFFNIRGGKRKTVKKFKRIYNDMLIDTFEKHTAWYIRL